VQSRVPLADLWPGRRPIVGVVHLLPLPGAPRWGGSLRAVLDRALADARALVDAGLDGVLVENFHDAPFYPGPVPPETVAAIAVVAAEVARAVPVPVGVNVLRNDAAAALAVAVAAGARFIRVNVHTGAMLTDQGWIEGRAHETLRLRARLGAPVAILADVLVKHAAPPPGLEPGDAARDAWERGLADALVVTGPATGAPPDAARLEAVRAAAPEAPVWIGSGLSPANAATLLPLADGALVGSALMEAGRAGRPVDPERARALVAAARTVAGPPRVGGLP